MHSDIVRDYGETAQYAAENEFSRVKVATKRRETESKSQQRGRERVKVATKRQRTSKRNKEAENESKSQQRMSSAE